MNKLLDPPQPGLFAPTQEHPKQLMPSIQPFYETPAGAAYLGDSRELLKSFPDASVNLVFTSPPYALHFKKAYGNVSKADYVDWFLTFAREVHRVLRLGGAGHRTDRRVETQRTPGGGWRTLPSDQTKETTAR